MAACWDLVFIGIFNAYKIQYFTKLVITIAQIRKNVISATILKILTLVFDRKIQIFVEHIESIGQKSFFVVKKPFINWSESFFCIKFD